MKNSTLRCSNRMLLIFGISSISVLSHFDCYSQTSSATSKSQDLKNIQVPVFANEVERQEWIQNHPDEYLFLSGELKSTAIQQPVDEFPSFIDTGDSKKDIEDHQKKKNAWISAHPEEYLRMQETFTPSPEQLEIMNAKSTKTN